MRHPIASLLVAWTAVGCAAPAATTIPPNHGSAPAEESAANVHDRAAGVLERQAESEGHNRIECGPPAQGVRGSICWAQPRMSSASAHDAMTAIEQREAATEHRHVSQELRLAEARACADIDEADVIESPFSHRDDIVDAQVLEGPRPADGSQHIIGARVRFHELEKLSADWFQHVIDCHIARDNALGHDVPEFDYCPLVPRGATATVTAVPHGYIVDITSDDPIAAREIARRAMELMR